MSCESILEGLMEEDILEDLEDDMKTGEDVCRSLKEVLGAIEANKNLLSLVAINISALREVIYQLMIDRNLIAVDEKGEKQFIRCLDIVFGEGITSEHAFPGEGSYPQGALVGVVDEKSGQQILLDMRKIKEIYDAEAFKAYQKEEEEIED